MTGWLSGPNSHRAVSIMERSTSKLSYSELAENLLDLVDRIRGFEEELRSGTADLRQRRLSMIREGRELPGSDGLNRLPGWSDQLRSEQIALENRAIDEQTERAGIGFTARS